MYSSTIPKNFEMIKKLLHAMLPIHSDSAVSGYYRHNMLLVSALLSNITFSVVINPRKELCIASLARMYPSEANIVEPDLNNY